MVNAALPALADRMKTLASATRLRVLLVLRDGGLCACQIALILEVPASTVSSHLTDLRKAGIVSELRRGRFVWYALQRQDGVVPWLRLVARQAAEDPTTVADHGRAVHIRLVPPEMVLTSTGCAPPAGPKRARPEKGARRRPEGSGGVAEAATT